MWCKLLKRAPSDQSNSSQPKLWTPGPKSRIFSSHFVNGELTEENPHPNLNLGYPNFKKRVQAILGKKRKTRTSTDGISSPTNLSKQSQNEDIPGTTAKKEDQLEIVGSNQNIFLPKNIVSCDKLGDTSTVTTDNQHVDSSIVTHQNMDLLMSFFFIALKSTFLLLLNNTDMLYEINFHTSASNGEQIQSGNNGKTHEAVVIKYLVQRIKTLEKSNKKLNERLKNCICFQPVHKSILKNDEKYMFYTGIPKLSTFLNLCDFISPFVERNWRGAKSTRKPSSKFIKSNLNKKRDLLVS